MIQPKKPLRRSRGIAMALVVMAAAVAVTMSAMFLAEQTVSAQMSRNITNAAQARQIAESGLQLAVVYVQTTPTWRTAQVPGKWVTNQAFAGGTFTVNAADGWDSNGDGVITITAEGNANFNDPTHAVTLTVTGTYKGASWKAMAVVTPKGGAGTIVNGIVSSGVMTMSTGATVNSYDSSKGAYGGANAGSNAHVVTNSTAAGAVAVGTGGKLAGNVQVAPGGNPANTVSVGTGGTYTGTTTAMAKAITMPTITAPNLGATGGAFNVPTGGSATISSNMHVSSLSVGTGGNLKISGNVTIVSDGNVTVGVGGNLEVLNGSALKLYCKGALTISTGADNKTDGNSNLSALTVYNLSTTPVQFSAGGTFYGVLISPQAGVVASTGFRLFGAIMATSLTLGTGCAFHEDTHITSGGDAFTIPGAATTYAIRWLDTF